MRWFDEAAFAAGGLLLLAGAAAFRRTRRFLARCRTTEGWISGYHSEGYEEGVYYFSHIGFRDAAGVEHELRGPHGWQEPPEVGTAVSITYDPADPKNAWVTGTIGLWFIPWLIVLLGVAGIVAGFVIRWEGG